MLDRVARDTLQAAVRSSSIGFASVFSHFLAKHFAPRPRPPTSELTVCRRIPIQHIGGYR